ncbi:hypothetical protein AgCh_003300 [Apium graveolens]
MIEGLLLYLTGVLVGDAGLTLVCALGTLFLYSTGVLVGELWSHPALCTQELGITCPAIWWVILILGTETRPAFGVNRGYTCVRKSREIAIAECYPCAGRCIIREVLRLRFFESKKLFNATSLYHEVPLDLGVLSGYCAFSNGYTMYPSDVNDQMWDSHRKGLQVIPDM